MLAVVTDQSCRDLQEWHGCVMFTLGSRLFMELTVHTDDAVQTIATQLRTMLSKSYPEFYGQPATYTPDPAAGYGVAVGTVRMETKGTCSLCGNTVYSHHD